MKKFSFALVWLVVIVVMASCKKSDPTVLELSVETIYIDSVGGVAHVDVTSNKEWETIVLEDWIAISSSSGKGNGEVEITVLAMASNVDREAILTVKTTNGVMQQVKIEQSPRIKKSGLADITNYVSGVTSASVKCRMSVKEDYGNPVKEQGFCWSTTTNPTIDDMYIATVDTFAVISGLEENTTYYVRSYAKNKKGTSYGRQLEFVTKSITEKEGRIAKGFLVNDTSQVYFSKGNLQYQATTNTWRFAETQSDMAGGQNSMASSSYDGWIDLFGWGTSGSDVAPYTVTPSYSVYGDGERNIAGTRYDWGVFNAIGGGTSGEWRTMTCAEWMYLLFNRPNAKALRGLAMVAGIAGMVILPDNWMQPEECDFESSATSYSDNAYSTLQWLLMEKQGAVFLPAAGNRYNTNVKEGGVSGFYWSSTASGEYSAYSISFNDKSVTTDRSYRVYGRSVRLVQNLQ